MPSIDQKYQQLYAMLRSGRIDRQYLHGLQLEKAGKDTYSAWEAFNRWRGFVRIRSGWDRAFDDRISMHNDDRKQESGFGCGTRAQMMSTAIEGFDAILGGGLPKHHLYLIQGLAGSGKTTLACQIGFSHARQKKKVLILTLIAESHAKLMQHLRNFSFYDDALVGNEIVFFSGYNALVEGDLQGLLNFISASIGEQRAEILIIDGFRSVRDSHGDELSLSEFMHSLNSLVSTLGCTTFLLSPVHGNLPESENTLVDGLVELSQYHDGVRTIRELEVLKVRGSNHLLGKHAFEVTREGIIVYPRLEAMATCANHPAPSLNRLVSFGIPSWDKRTGGGVMEGSTTNIVGTPGAGKTLMGLHFIHQGLRDNEKCLILGFYESPERLVQKAKKVSLDLTSFFENGCLDMIWRLPVEVMMDELALRVFDNIDKRGVKRLLIDGVDGFRHIAIHPERLKSFLIAFVNGLRVRGVTTLFTQELPYFKESLAENESVNSVLYENMLLLNYTERGGVNYRQISVIKMRENDYDPAVHLMKISGAGIAVEGSVSGLKVGSSRTKSSK
jgi:circadian clock protein KaiC